MAGFSFGVVHAFVLGWEQESHILDLSTASEIEGGAVNLLRAHKNLHKAALAVSDVTKISLQQVGWPNSEAHAAISVSKAALRGTHAWLVQHLGIADFNAKANPFLFYPAETGLECSVLESTDKAENRRTKKSNTGYARCVSHLQKFYISPTILFRDA